MKQDETEQDVMEYIWQGCSAYRRNCRNCPIEEKCFAFHDKLIDNPDHKVKGDILSKLRVYYDTTTWKQKNAIITTLCAMFGWQRKYAQYELTKGG